MKVVLKPSVRDKIKERIYAAKRDRREVDYILVSHDEYSQLRRECHHELEPYYMKFDPNASISPTFRTIDLVDPHAHYLGDRMRVVSHEKFMGFDLYVVPERFCG